jgi:hypothetical protein
VSSVHSVVIAFKVELQNGTEGRGYNSLCQGLTFSANTLIRIIEKPFPVTVR